MRPIQIFYFIFLINILYLLLNIYLYDILKKTTFLSIDTTFINSHINNIFYTNNLIIDDGLYDIYNLVILISSFLIGRYHKSYYFVFILCLSIIECILINYLRRGQVSLVILSLLSFMLGSLFSKHKKIKNV